MNIKVCQFVHGLSKKQSKSKQGKFYTTAKAGMQVLEIKSVILKYKYHNRTTCSECSALVAAEVSSLHP